ncbi:50S ribosomal protein L10 [Candidatus Pacearchaeota archaeon RBG_19FT_COMBO_34_9]|nr:MAG: 50S ribosomal protein L10 [Candidatus Pacearchaeota archaeon RBG_19FT_COMBO_34_9]OGJ16162.1 MAG: 50S ribosomal protein L10 [Candidatus Pacearchaeota archaeon RBG_13_33_26]
MTKKTSGKTTHVSEVKKKTVKELTELIKKKRTVLIASIKNIPASQFQEIVKRLRGKAIVKVPKKNLIIRALDSSEDEKIREINKKINENVAVLFSDMDCFELAAELVKNKNPAKAKAGQEAPEDIEIPAGPTELTPGPAISELGAVGLQIMIDKGKLSIKESKVLIKKGEKISAAVADVLNKLDIKPITINLIPLAGYDSHEKKIYLDIKINREEAIENLKKAFGKSLPFAVEIGYATPDTIKFILLRAHTNAKALEKFENAPEVNSVSDENRSEENK